MPPMASPRLAGRSGLSKRRAGGMITRHKRHVHRAAPARAEQVPTLIGGWIMSRIFTSVDQLIGGTPLLELRNIEKEFALKARLLAKLYSASEKSNTIKTEEENGFYERT